MHDGLSVWDFASDDNPDVVLVGIGDYMTKEAMAAVELTKTHAPEIRIRFVNVTRLSAACSCKEEFHSQIPNAEKYFTLNKPVIVNFHGYPEVMQAMLFHVNNPQRFSVHGYREQGGTTTPFDMQVRNKTSRYDLAIEIAEKMKESGVISVEKAEELIAKYTQALAEHHSYIIEHGADPVEIEQWQWSGKHLPKRSGTSSNHMDLLKHARTIAFIGLSDKPERHSYRVAKYFQDKGYRIVPVNPNLAEVLGEKSYPDLLSIPKDIRIDIVDIFRKSEEILAHLEEVTARGDINTVWLAEGVSSQDAVDFAEDYGLNLITNFCIMEAYKKMEA